MERSRSPMPKSKAPANCDQEVIAAVERELIQIGNELHESLSQSLAGTSLILEKIGRSVTEREPIAPESLALLRRILHSAIGQARSLSQRFRPVKLSGLGFLAALQELARDNANADCEFIC